MDRTYQVVNKETPEASHPQPGWITLNASYPNADVLNPGWPAARPKAEPLRSRPASRRSRQATDHRGAADSLLALCCCKEDI